MSLRTGNRARSCFRLAFCAMLALIASAIKAPVAAAADPTPGSFVVTVKGLLPSGVQFTRLAMYSFQPTGTLREDFWIWYHNSPWNYGNTSRRIGYVNQPDYPANVDRDKYITGALAFHGEQSSLTTAFGTWSRAGNSINIVWSWQDTESWQITWKDPSLFKMELVGASYLSGQTYLSRTAQGLVRTPSAFNVGWGFGGPGTGFTTGASVDACRKDYKGLLMRLNMWRTPPVNEPVTAAQMNLTQFFKTDNDVFRLVQWDQDWTPQRGAWGFNYFSRPVQNDGLLARRVMYQNGHDSDSDGYISDETGHTYSGLQIIDMAGALRGFVFAEVSPSGITSPPTNTVSSLYYLDDWSDAAHYGISP